MSNFNRREFLKISAATAAVTAVPEVMEAFASAAPQGEIQVWSTFKDQRHAKQQPLRWSTNRKTNNVIQVDASRQYQQVLGFGAAFTDAACFTLNRLNADVRKQLFNELFGPAEMGLSVSRICVGSSDYATRAYNYTEGTEPDPELQRFSIDHDREYILPILREARVANPNLWLLASPWSPPAWMKFNKSMLGGSMRRYWLGVYAQYFDRFLAAYAAAGVRVNSITPQNEVDTDQDGRMPACIWPQEYEIEFVRDHLGPVMAKSANPADIWILDHNYNLWGRALCELEDEGARKYVKGIAWHGYAGSPDAMTRVKNTYPAIDNFWTEGGPDFDTPGYETEWAKWGDQFAGILRNSARSIIAWNYALDEKGKPNIGPFNCAGMVTIHSATKEITRSGQYWAMRHFASHIRRDARIVHSAGEITRVSHVVAKNPDGSFTAILTNSGKEEANVTLAVDSSSATLVLVADSMTTLTWS